MDLLTSFPTELLDGLTISKPIVVLLTMLTGLWYKKSGKVSNRWLIPALLVAAPILEFLAVFLTSGFVLPNSFTLSLGAALWSGFQDVCVSQFLYQFWKSTWKGNVEDKAFKETKNGTK